MKKLAGLNYQIENRELRTDHWKLQLAELGFELEFLDGSSFDLQKNWKSLPKDQAWVSLTEEEIDFSLTTYQNISSEINLSKNCDALVQLDHAWWVRDFWSLALIESVVRRAPQLDTHSLAYVTGQGRPARAAVVALIKMGFAKIMWVSDEPESTEAAIAEIQRKFFSIELGSIDGSRLTLQPNNGSILVNTIALDSGEAILQDLLYLNFIKKKGVVVDIHLLPTENHLLTEAEMVDVHTVPGWYLLGVRDCLFLNAVLAGQLAENQLPVDKYLESWQNFLKTRLMSSQK